MELVERAISNGFSIKAGQGTAFVALEQLERWIWNEHRGLFPMIYKVPKVGLKEESFISDTEAMIQFPDPFSARLAGVERVIEELERRKTND